MRHQIKLRKFGRESHQRKALLRSLCTSLVKYEKIETTLAKAKDLRRVMEKAVTLAKNYNNPEKLNAKGGEGQTVEQHLAAIRAAKRVALSSYFNASQDREILGRNEIKKYISNLKTEDRKAVEKYMEDQSNPKPEFVLDYIPAVATRKVTIKKTVDGKTVKEEITKERGKKREVNGKTVGAASEKRGGATRILRVEGVLTKLLNRIAPRFKDVNGGYTQIYKLGNRRGDNAEMAIIQFSK